MRTQRIGQATFIPLDTITIPNVPDKLRNMGKGARLAVDCIQFPPAIERAAQYVCGTALICDTTAIAKNIRYEQGQEVKGGHWKSGISLPLLTSAAVTLEGTVIHRSGLISGGQGASGGKALSDQEIKVLNAQKEQHLKQLTELARSKPKEKDDEALLEALARLDAEGSIAKDELVSRPEHVRFNYDSPTGGVATSSGWPASRAAAYRCRSEEAIPRSGEDGQNIAGCRKKIDGPAESSRRCGRWCLWHILQANQSLEHSGIRGCSTQDGEGGK